MGCVLVAGVLLMSGSAGAAGSEANQDAALTLQDGSHWHVQEKAYNYQSIIGLVEVAFKKGGAIFISGSRQEGTVDDVAVPRKLAALQVEARSSRCDIGRVAARSMP
jgi:hypothetical protein